MFELLRKTIINSTLNNVLNETNCVPDSLTLMLAGKPYIGRFVAWCRRAGFHRGFRLVGCN